jgi:hypothetical protein
MSRHAGRNGAVYISTTGTTTQAAPVTQAAWSCNFSTEKIDVTSFRDVNLVKVQGLPDVAGEFSGFWEDTELTLFTASRSNDGVKMYLYPDIANAPNAYIYGPAWVDFSIKTAVSGAVEVSGTFAANGNWGVRNI